MPITACREHYNIFQSHWPAGRGLERQGTAGNAQRYLNERWSYCTGGLCGSGQRVRQQAALQKQSRLHMVLSQVNAVH
jgi:hypothetical protein